MASPALSSDEGEIVEATPLPRSEQNGDVDRTGRHRRRFPSRSPDRDRDRDGPSSSSKGPVDAPRRRSRSRSPPRAWKRPREDHRDRRDARDSRDSRHFRVHYEDSPRDDRRSYRDLDRPSSATPARYDGHYDDRDSGPPRPKGGARYPDGPGNGHDRRNDGYPYKRPRTRSRSPRSDRGRRDGGRYGASALRPGEDKYSAHAERRPQDGSMSKRATPGEARDVSRLHAKTDKGATVEKGIHDLAISQDGYVPAPDSLPCFLTSTC